MGALRLDHDAMRRARRRGAKLSDVARQFGCSDWTAKKVCRGVVCMVDHQREAALRNVAKAIETRFGDVKRRRGPQTEHLLGSTKPRELTVPAWVARAGLTEDYRDFRTAFDDHYAARVCRRLVHEARRPC